MERKTVVLTFDDAVSNHASFVAPLLVELGFHATFFLCEFPPDFAVNKRQYMTWEEIRSLAFYGCSKLADVTVPSSLNMLWNFVFHQCAPMDYRYAGTLAQLIILYARSSHFLSYNTDDVFGESIAKDLKKLFRFYDTCPEDFKDFDDGEFSDEFFGPGLDIPGLQNLYVGGALLQGTLYYPKEAAEFGGSIASCDLFEGYKKLKDVSLPKGYSRKNMACCILCGWPEKPSLFGKCKKCGAKYVTRKEEDQ